VPFLPRYLGGGGDCVKCLLYWGIFPSPLLIKLPWTVTPKKKITPLAQRWDIVPRLRHVYGELKIENFKIIFEKKIGLKYSFILIYTIS